MDKLLKELKVVQEGEMIDGVYVVTLNDYDEFSSMYNRLESSVSLSKDSTQSSMDEEDAHILFDNEDYIVELIALFEEDDYTLNITSLKEEEKTNKEEKEEN